MVKTILKRNNILLSQFASDLSISRPTLDTYIRNYENGIQISNVLFQKIFEYLFSDITISNLDFRDKYDQVISKYGLSSKTSTFTNVSMLEKIINDNSIKRYLSKDELDVLGDLILDKDSLLLHLLKVNLILNNTIELKSLSDKEKMLTIGLYELSEKLKDGDFSYNSDMYKKLEDVVIKKNEPVTKQELKEKILDNLSQLIDDALEKGDTKTITKIIHNIKQVSQGGKGL